MEDQDPLACLLRLLGEIPLEVSQPAQLKTKASLDTLPDHVVRRILSYSIDRNNSLTAFVKADYDWTQDDATVMMHDSWQHWALYGIQQINPRFCELALEYVHDRAVVVCVGEASFSEALAYDPENPERIRREPQKKLKRRWNTRARKAALAVQDFQRYHDRVNPNVTKTFFFWNPMLQDVDLAKIHHLHFTFGHSKFEWYWKWVPRCMRGFCQQRLNDERDFPKQLLLEFFDRKQKHRYRPNGKYVDNKLTKLEPGFRYEDLQFKHYERTLKFMEHWLIKLEGRVRVSFPYWMKAHQYSTRITNRFRDGAGIDVIYHPFKEDERYNREWGSGQAPPRSTPFGPTTQPGPMSELDFYYRSGEESPVDDDIDDNFEDSTTENESEEEVVEEMIDSDDEGTVDDEQRSSAESESDDVDPLEFSGNVNFVGVIPLPVSEDEKEETEDEETESEIEEESEDEKEDDDGEKEDDYMSLDDTDHDADNELSDDEDDECDG